MIINCGENIMESGNEFYNKAKALFEEYRESFDCDDEIDLIRQGEFEGSFSILLCEFGSHTFIQDQCGKPEHDFCSMCNVRIENIKP